MTSAHPQILKKKKLVSIYKFKKYRYAKVPTLIFVLNPHLCFRKKIKKIKEDKCIKITSKHLKQSKIIAFTTNNKQPNIKKKG